MATNRPDPGDFLELAQRMLRQLFDDRRGDDASSARARRPNPGPPRRTTRPGSDRDGGPFS